MAKETPKIYDEEEQAKREQRERMNAAPRMTPLEVLQKLVDEGWLQCYAPLDYLVCNIDTQLTVGELIHITVERSPKIGERKYICRGCNHLTYGAKRACVIEADQMPISCPSGFSMELTCWKNIEEALK